MRKIISFFTLLCLSLVIHAQGIYQIWGISGTGGEDYMGAMFSTTAKGDNFYKRYQIAYDDAGANPQHTVPVEYNGKFYGMTNQGGNGDGVIFEWDPQLNIYSKKIELNVLKGIYPYGSLTLYNNKFYGMTSEGGISGQGVIFEWNPLTNDYTKKIDFGGTDGGFPRGGLTIKDGKFYGMTFAGGETDEGVIFEWNPETNVYLKKFDLSASNGSYPSGNLALRAGKFYGMTEQGGAHGKGVIFEWDPSNNSFTKKIDLDATRGHSPYGTLTLSGDKFYGVALQGGQHNLGSIFEWDPSTNNFARKIDLSLSIGALPYGNLVRIEGKFYGTTRRGGQNDKGVIFEWNPTGNAYVKKVDLDNVNGAMPKGGLVFSNSKFYGLTSAGGSSGSGTIFEWDPAANSYTKKIDLRCQYNGNNPSGVMVRYKGKFYGTTSQGGNNDVGVIYEFDPNTLAYTKMRDFNAATGCRSYSSMVLHNNKFYGTTESGGTNNLGTIFEWDPATNTYNNKFNFNAGGGSKPFAGIVLHNGKFYGLTPRGGVNDAGVIFEWDPASNLYTKKIDFDVTNGSYPRGSFIVSSGKFYGMTERGGASDLGVIFEWDPASNQYTKKLEFDGNNGSIPVGNLTQGTGKFYGMTNSGGIHNEGVIFEWEPTGNVYTKKFDFSFNDGKYPLGSLTWSGAKLFGTTQIGGLHDRGVLFEWDPETNQYTKKKEFEQSDGNGPSNGNDLILAPAPVAQGIPDNCVNFPTVTIDQSNNNIWVPIIDNRGDAVAEIKANGNILGVINASTFINEGTVREDQFNKLYLDRNITITPEHQPTSAVDIRIYIRGEEYEALKNAVNSGGTSSGIDEIQDLGIYKNNVGCSETVLSTTDIAPGTAMAWEDDYVITASIMSFSSFYFANKTQGGPLPVSDLQVSGRLVNKDGLITWKTTDELNTHSFEVERSLNGRHYTAVATLPAFNHSGIHYYDYTDRDITSLGVPVVYYRLRQVDIDGRFGYSTVVALATGNKNNLMLYPNPVSENANITINVVKAQQLQLRLVDHASRIMYRYAWKVNSGTNNYSINVSGLARGSYYLEVIGETFNERKHFIKN